MTTRTLEDLIKETITSSGNDEVSEFELQYAADVADGFEETDVVMLLSWQGGIMLTMALRRIEHLKDNGMEAEDIEGMLTEKEKKVIYGAFLLSETLEPTIGEIK